MKKLFIIIAATSLFIACEKKEVKPVPAKDTVLDSAKIIKDSAKVVLNKANALMEKGIKKEMSQSEVNKKIEPLMKQYMEYLSKLSPADSTDLQNYRVKKVNEIIDLQMSVGQ